MTQIYAEVPVTVTFTGGGVSPNDPVTLPDDTGSYLSGAYAGVSIAVAYLSRKGGDCV